MCVDNCHLKSIPLEVDLSIHLIFSLQYQYTPVFNKDNHVTLSRSYCTISARWGSIHSFLDIVIPCMFCCILSVNDWAICQRSILSDNTRHLEAIHVESEGDNQILLKQLHICEIQCWVISFSRVGLSLLKLSLPFLKSDLKSDIGDYTRHVCVDCIFLFYFLTILIIEMFLDLKTLTVV